MVRYSRIFLLFVFGLLLNLQYLGQGCSQCRDRMAASQGAEVTVGNGINIGITILMTVPYIILFFMFRTKIVKFLKEFFGMWKTKEVSSKES